MMRGNEYELVVWRHPIGKELRWSDASRLQPRQKEKGRWLVSTKTPKETQIQPPVSDWSPSRDQDLFLRFASLEETEPAILEFATRHGLIGIEQEVMTPESRGSSTPGESFGAWVDEIRFMRDACDLAFALEADGDRTLFLREHITIDVREERSHSSVRFRGDAGSSVQIWALVKANRWVGAGKRVLAEMINSRLGNQAQIRATIRNHKLEPQMMLSSLLGEMWVQLLDHYTDSRLFYCAACGKENVHKPQIPGKRKPHSNRALCYDSKTGKTLDRCKSLAKRQRKSTGK
jgi:hypothetical protein